MPRVPQEKIAEVLHLVDEVLAPQLEEMDGFIPYECLDCSDEKAAARSLELSRQFVRGDLADIEIEPLDGEVAVSRARSEVLEPAHA